MTVMNPQPYLPPQPPQFQPPPQPARRREPESPGFFESVRRGVAAVASAVDSAFQGFRRAVQAWWTKLTGRDRENALYYEQRSGTLFHHDAQGRRVILATGLLSGRGEGLNNPSQQYVRNVGVAPEGAYRLSHHERAFTVASIGRNVRMTPLEESQMRGRDGILMHQGGRLASGQMGSHGCITFATNAQRDAVFEYIRRNNITHMWVFDGGNPQRLNTFYSGYQAANPQQRPVVPSPAPAAQPQPWQARPAHAPVTQTAFQPQAYNPYAPPAPPRYRSPPP